MKINELCDLVQNSLEDMKAADIVKLDVVKLWSAEDATDKSVEEAISDKA